MQQKDPMMEALNAKRGGLVLKISIEPDGAAAVQAEPDGDEGIDAGMVGQGADTEGSPDEEENRDGQDDIAPPPVDMQDMDQAMIGGMSDYDKQEAMQGPQKSLGMKARAAALSRMGEKK